MLRRTALTMVFTVIVLLASIGAFALSAPQSPAQPKSEKQPAMIIEGNGLRRFTSLGLAAIALPPNIAPASCDEWATQSPPPASIGTKCKVLGGQDFCYRVMGTHAGSYDIGPIVGQQQVGKPLTVHFRMRNFGSGDAVVYGFGKVDWGDNSQQDLVPFNYDVALTHTYTSEKSYVLHAMGGLQFKYQARNGSGLLISGSYEGCVDNSIPVKITP